MSDTRYNGYGTTPQITLSAVAGDTMSILIGDGSSEFDIQHLEVVGFPTTAPNAFVVWSLIVFRGKFGAIGGQVKNPSTTFLVPNVADMANLGGFQLAYATQFQMLNAANTKLIAPRILMCGKNEFLLAILSAPEDHSAGLAAAFVAGTTVTILGQSYAEGGSASSNVFSGARSLPRYANG